MTLAGALVILDDVRDDVPDLVEIYRVSRQESQGGLGVAEYRCQRLIQLVGKCTGQLPQQCHPREVRQLIALLRHLRLQCPAWGDIDDGRQYSGALGSIDRIEADFERHFATVLAPAVQIATDTHRPCGGRLEEAVTIVGMGGAVRLGNQDVDGAAQQLFAGVAEYPLRLRVEQVICPS